MCLWLCERRLVFIGLNIKVTVNILVLVLIPFFGLDNHGVMGDGACQGGMFLEPGLVAAVDKPLNCFGNRGGW